MTGASRGIGLAIAAAYADAGADIIGVSASLPAGDSESGRRAVEARGREFTAYATDFADRSAVLALADEVESLGPPGRRTGQQRGHDRPRAGGRALRRALAPGAAGESLQSVHADPGGRPRDGCSRRRQSHLHRISAELPGRHQRPRLHRCQERDRRTDQSPRKRVGGQASTSTPSLRATSPPTTPAPCGPTWTVEAFDPRAHPCRTLGDLPTTSPEPRCSWPPRPPTTSTARCSPSTAAGWGGE